MFLVRSGRLIVSFMKTLRLVTVCLPMLFFLFQGCLSPTDSDDDTPELTLDKTRLVISGSSDSAVFTISNSGGGSLEWRIETGETSAWLTTDKSSGTGGAAVTVTVTVTIDRARIPSGIETASIDIISNGGNHTIMIVIDNSGTSTGTIIIEGTIPREEP